MANLDQIMDYVADNTIIEQGTSGDWTYRKWSNGTAECWYSKVYDSSISPDGQVGSSGIYHGNVTLTTPFSFVSYPCGVTSARWGTGVSWSCVRDYTASNQVRIQLYRNNNSGSNPYLQVYIRGELL